MYRKYCSSKLRGYSRDRDDAKAEVARVVETARVTETARIVENALVRGIGIELIMLLLNRC